MTDTIVIQPQINTLTITEDVNDVVISSVGAQGIQGPAGATGATGATGAQGPSGVIAVTAPITNSGTSTSANIGISAGSTSAAGALQLTDSVSSTSTITAATPNAVKTAYDIGFIKSLDWISSRYYRTFQDTATTTAAEDATYYTPIFVPSTCTVDRLAITTAGTFTGTASVRLGIYGNTNSAPDQLILDAGTVSATAASSSYTITINQSLSAGIYWLAVNTQTTATTNAFLGANGPARSAIPGMPLTGANSSGYFAGYSQTGVTGAFANASSPTLTSTVILAAVRKA
jgi:hypothetical protein